MTLGGSTSRRAITDGNGLYSFVNVDTGGFYTITPGLANHTFSPASRSFSLLGSRADAAFTAVETAPTESPLDSAEYFVRQQYLDFLGREPDQAGFDYWSAQIRDCGNDAACVRARRISVSAAFFVGREFQDTGFFIYQLYKTSLGIAPAYGQYVVDRAKVVGGSAIDAQREAFAREFAEREEFVQLYPEWLGNAGFVNKLFDTAGLPFSEIDRDRYIFKMDTGSSRVDILRDLIEESRVKTSQYNPAFVLMQYFGYLRRDAEPAGYQFWLNVLNNQDSNNYPGMVCLFLSSVEYQRRFSEVITHNNAECYGTSAVSSLGVEFVKPRQAMEVADSEEEEEEEEAENGR